MSQDFNKICSGEGLQAPPKQYWADLIMGFLCFLSSNGGKYHHATCFISDRTLNVFNNTVMHKKYSVCQYKQAKQKII